MTYAELDAEVEDLRAEGVSRIQDAATQEILEQERVHLLGRESGRVTALMQAMPTLTLDEKRRAGPKLNALKHDLEARFEARKDEFSRAARSVSPRVDLTMPARSRWRGGSHPVTIVIDEIVAIFRELGFTIALGPESESEWYNFGALNFPADHPAMDMHDTFYLGEGALLRTHTSPVQIRTLQRTAPPVRVLAPGTVFRRDPFDASHAPAFAQLEGLAIDEGVSFVDLKATLTHFARTFFGPTTRTRFRPSYFPFTEPSAEMDVECQLCGGTGCAACKGSGWMEIMGAGMVHPIVLESAGIDSERYTGWAFGMGPARIAMQRYALPDIRLLYDSDMRFLQQGAQ